MPKTNKTKSNTIHSAGAFMNASARIMKGANEEERDTAQRSVSKLLFDLRGSDCFEVSTYPLVDTNLRVERTHHFTGEELQVKFSGGSS